MSPISPFMSVVVIEEMQAVEKIAGRVQSAHPMMISLRLPPRDPRKQAAVNHWPRLLRLIVDKGPATTSRDRMWYHLRPVDRVRSLSSRLVTVHVAEPITNLAATKVDITNAYAGQSR